MRTLSSTLAPALLGAGSLLLLQDSPAVDKAKGRAHGWDGWQPALLAGCFRGYS